ncbi:MAG: hypothetical protein JNL69_13535 [Bacteroidia bacterium]|nr:hypothetical protein [Bacteroidia bacterium]
MKKHLIIYSFQSIEDPLLKGLMLEYILRLNNNSNDVTYHLISHEQEPFILKGVNKNRKYDYLKNRNIIWYPINYKNGKLLLLKKLLNFIQTLIICLKIKIKFKPKAIIGFLPIAGGFSYIIANLLRLKLIVFCFEPHSDYMVDFKIWKKKSIKYKLLNKFETLQLKNADYLVLPTSYSIHKANLVNPHSKKYLVPISIDTDAMKFSLEKRQKVRTEINANNKIVIIYTGKFGGIYYSSDEIISFFKKLYEQNKNYFIYIITPNTNDVNTSIKKQQLSSDSYFVSNTVPYEELSFHISAADIGLVAVPPFPSQKYRTPVKSAIYLSCGIPYIINKGIAEDDLVAEKENVGIVVENIKMTSAESIDRKIISLLSNDRALLRENCKKTAKKYRGIDNSTLALYEIINDLFA